MEGGSGLLVGCLTSQIHASVSQGRSSSNALILTSSTFFSCLLTVSLVACLQHAVAVKTDMSMESDSSFTKTL